MKNVMLMPQNLQILTVCQQHQNLHGLGHCQSNYGQMSKIDWYEN